MLIKIPNDFDVSKQNLDSLESVVRDQLKLNIVAWAKFRHTIHIGNEAVNLKSKTSTAISATVKGAYRELAKSHYEVVTSLGSAGVLATPFIRANLRRELARDTLRG